MPGYVIGGDILLDVTPGLMSTSWYLWHRQLKVATLHALMLLQNNSSVQGFPSFTSAFSSDVTYKYI